MEVIKIEIDIGFLSAVLSAIYCIGTFFNLMVFLNTGTLNYTVFWIIVSIMLLFAFLLICSNIKGAIPLIKRKKEIKKLLTSNNKIMAQVEKVEPAVEGVLTKDFQKKNINNGDQIICSWIDPETNEKYEFGSDGIDKDIDIKYVVGEFNIKTLPVYLDPKDRGNYFVDIRELLNKCNF